MEFYVKAPIQDHLLLPCRINHIGVLTDVIFRERKKGANMVNKVIRMIKDTVTNVCALCVVHYESNRGPQYYSRIRVIQCVLFMLQIFTWKLVPMA